MKPTLEIRLHPKTLKIGDEKVTLAESSLYCIETFSQRKTDYLNLIYRNPEVIEEEAEKIYLALERQKLDDQITVSQGPKNHKEPLVNLFGKFATRVYLD